MTERSKAVDDYPAIKARMDELRREAAGRPRAGAGTPMFDRILADPRTPASVRRFILKYRDQVR
jgi:hypothetical protein